MAHSIWNQNRMAATRRQSTSLFFFLTVANPQVPIWSETEGGVSVLALSLGTHSLIPLHPSIIFYFSLYSFPRRSLIPSRFFKPFSYWSVKIFLLGPFTFSLITSIWVLFGFCQREKWWGSSAVSWGSLVLLLESLLVSWLGSLSLFTQKPDKWR